VTLDYHQSDTYQIIRRLVNLQTRQLADWPMWEPTRPQIISSPQAV